MAYSSAADRSFLAWLAVVAFPLGLLLLGAWPPSVWAKHRVGESWSDVVTFREAPAGVEQRTARLQFAIAAVLLIVATGVLFNYLLDHVIF